jgi:hypothetical protein
MNRVKWAIRAADEFQQRHAWLLKNNPDLRQKLLNSALKHYPVIGSSRRASAG